MNIKNSCFAVSNVKFERFHALFDVYFLFFVFLCIIGLIHSEFSFLYVLQECT